jgi:hypothetical protein
MVNIQEVLMARKAAKIKAFRLSITAVLLLALSGCIWVHSDKHEDVYHHDDDHPQVDPDHH